MIRLFDDSDNFTTEANDISREITAALRPLLVKYSEAGISLRDVSYIAVGDVHLLVSELTVRRQIAERKAKLTVKHGIPETTLQTWGKESETKK